MVLLPFCSHYTSSGVEAEVSSSKETGHAMSDLVSSGPSHIVPYCCRAEGRCLGVRLGPTTKAFVFTKWLYSSACAHDVCLTALWTVMADYVRTPLSESMPGRPSSNSVTRLRHTLHSRKRAWPQEGNTPRTSGGTGEQGNRDLHPDQSLTSNICTSRGDGVRRCNFRWSPQHLALVGPALHHPARVHKRC